MEVAMAIGSIGRTWSEGDIPGQYGRTAVVTGANAGIGFQIARVLAQHGANVVLACRDTGRAEQAASRIRAELDAVKSDRPESDLPESGGPESGGPESGGPESDRPESGRPEKRRGSVAVLRLDLASLASVREAAELISSRYPQLALLINNAGVMEVPYVRTEDGFELTFATNHLGHFALTGLLLDQLLAVPGSRIVTMSSQAHIDGAMNFDDLQGERDYEPAAAYAQSKLANLLFTYELDRRLRAAGSPTTALAAHPGVVLTSLFGNRSKLEQLILSPLMRPLNFRHVQNVRMGALPALRAATDPGAVGGEFYGPRRRYDTGYPARVSSIPQSHDAADQARLWQASEHLTEVRYPLEARTA
jgi:NAD(P)-dependent dehydrogenase (short-subunit alcohol dehydrogenase family)